MDDVMREQTWTSFFRFLIRHPKSVNLAYQIVMQKKIWEDVRRLDASRKIHTLLWFTLRHPLVAAKYVWPTVKFTRSRSDGADQEVEPREPLAELDPPDAEWRDGILDPIEEADRLYLDRQLLSAAERHQDAQLFGGHDRDRDGFVRLVLRESYHDLFVPGHGEDTEAVVFEPRLFLHWSGVAMLTIRVKYEGSFSTDELIELLMGSEPRIARSRMPEPLVKGGVLEHLVTHWSEEKLDAGARLAVFEWDEAISMTELLSAQMDLLERVIGARFNQYLTYPVSMVDAGRCCPPAEFQTTHANDIKRITMRAQTLNTLASHVKNEPDWSSTVDHSLFVNLGSTTRFQWSGQRPVDINELHTTLVIEYGLSLYARLQAMEADVSRMRLGERRLRRRYRNAILLFSELRQGDVRAGTARAIVRHLLTELGADQIRPTIESALNLASMAHGTMSTQRSSRRAWWLALVGTVVAGIVSGPAITTLLGSLPEQRQGDFGELILGPLRWAASLGYWGAWAVLGSTAGLMFAFWLIGVIARRWPRIHLDLRRGYAWPTEMQVVYRDENAGDRKSR